MSTNSGLPATIQVWLGHETLATTQKYLEPSKETEKQLEEMKLPFQITPRNSFAKIA